METRNDQSKRPQPQPEQKKSRLERRIERLEDRLARWSEKLEERLAPCPLLNPHGKLVGNDHYCPVRP